MESSSSEESDTDVSTSGSDSSSEELDRSSQIKTRKRLRNPDLWKRNKRKRLRNRGEAYENSKGVLVPARASGDHCKCKLNCFVNISANDRAKILEEFNDLASFDVQNGYLHGLIRGFEPKRRYTSKGKNSKRSKTYQYFIRRQGQQTRVCLSAFCSIHI